MEVRPEVFSLYGREVILARLTQRLDALKKGYRQNVALVGPRFIGKTAILRHFLNQIHADSEIIAIYVDSNGVDFESFSERWLGGLLQGFLTSRGIAFPEQFQTLVRISRAYIPKTLEKMREAKKHAFQKKFVLAFRELLSLTGTLAEETGKKVLLTLDEFQGLGGLEIPDPLGLFGKEMMIQKNTFYLATSSEPHRSREIFGERLSLLFGNFEVIEVGALNYDSIRTWVMEASPQLGMGEEDLRWLSHFFDNHTHYFQMFLTELRRLSRDSETATRAFLQQVIKEALFEDRSLFNQHFEFQLQGLLRLARSTRPYIRILLAIAAGRSKSGSIAVYIGRKVPETQKLLQRLVGEGIIQRKGSFYQITDRLFRFWLRHVYEVKDRDLSPGKERARMIFENRLSEEIRRIETEDQADLTSRIESLFREFANEPVEINGKRTRFPHFLEITTRPTNGRYFPIQGQTRQENWFCQVFREYVTEGDVADFLHELKESRRKVQRKIVMALSGIDLNAKLMAQEARIQIWNLENLNALLDLYGKLKILF